MSWILGIDTSSSILGLGIVQDKKPVAAVTRFVRNSHAEHITKGMQFLLESAGINASDITHAAVTAGPGSFTGLRIGISFIKGMFISQQVPITAVSSLESIAQSHTITNGNILVGMDARQDRIFTAEFKKENGLLSRVTEDKILHVDEFKEETKDKEHIICDVLGNGKSTVFNFLSDHKGLIHAESSPFQRGLSAAIIGSNRLDDSKQWNKATDILPEYMQESYAEKMHKQRGA